MGHPGLYSLLEAAEFLGVSEIVVKDFIDCGDLATVGSRKEHIRLVDLNKNRHPSKIKSDRLTFRANSVLMSPAQF